MLSWAELILIKSQPGWKSLIQLYNKFVIRCIIILFFTLNINVPICGVPIPLSVRYQCHRPYYQLDPPPSAWNGCYQGYKSTSLLPDGTRLWKVELTFLKKLAAPSYFWALVLLGSILNFSQIPSFPSYKMHLGFPNRAGCVAIPPTALQCYFKLHYWFQSSFVYCVCICICICICIW